MGVLGLLVCWCAGVSGVLDGLDIYVYFCDSANTKDTLDKTLHARAVLHCLHHAKQTKQIEMQKKTAMNSLCSEHTTMRCLIT